MMLEARLTDLGSDHKDWEVWDHEDHLEIRYKGEGVRDIPYIPGVIQTFVVAASLARGFMVGAVWNEQRTAE